VAFTSRQDKAPKPVSVTLRRCWFSDGGICSNLPIHFFDALLPRWPTFALSLRPEPADDPVWLAESGKAGSEAENVWIPKNELAGGADNWQLVGDSAGTLGATGLLASMLDTMQNWNDNMLAKAPGYRDRIVLTSLRGDEGGLNLDMPNEVIKRLSERGRAAGDTIASRFGATDTGWRDHVWVRYRASLGMLQELLGEAHRTYFATTSDPQLRETLDGLIATPPEWLKLDGDERAAAEKVNAAFAKYDAVSTADFFAPPPVFELRPRPRSA
jgi:predicted acylesterase/phospholipase RssA